MRRRCFPVVLSNKASRPACSSSAKEEASCIQGLRIEIGKDGIDQLFHVAVKGSVCHIINRKENVKLGPCGLAVFYSVIEAAVLRIWQAADEE